MNAATAPTTPSNPQVSPLCRFQKPGRPEVSVISAWGGTEHGAVLGAHVEHGRRPLAADIVATGADGGEIERRTALRHRHIHRITCRDARVEDLAERQRRAIGDRELHRDHRRHAVGDQRCGDARERMQTVELRRGAGVAGVEEHEPQRLVAQQMREGLGGGRDRVAVRILEQQHAALGGGEVAMTHVMHHVVRGAGQPVEDPVLDRIHLVDHHTGQLREAAADEFALTVEVERRSALGVGADEQHAQRAVDRPRRDDLVHIEAAHQHRLRGHQQRIGLDRLAHQLPRQGGDRSGPILQQVEVHAEPDPTVRSGRGETFGAR
jgi:hypothetical protein